MGAIIVVILWG